MSGLYGIWGKPYIDLEHEVDGSQLEEIDAEISAGLGELDVSYTGGSLKWMNVVAPWVHEDPYVDLMHAIQAMDRDELARFVALSDDPSVFDLDRRAEYAFGDETDHPLNRRQTLWLERRHRVYFPWKVCYHLVANDRWEDKHSGAGKAFDEDAERVLPKTVALVRGLPFSEIGRCVVFGLAPNDHAPMHRDSEPGRDLSIAHSISIDPRGDKRFALCAPDRGSHTIVESRVYWFNDMDYHGVEAAPFFRYSIRVDGVFDRAWLERLRRRMG